MSSNIFIKNTKKTKKNATIHNIIGLLPCAGTSSRLFNIPKFMLPLKNEKSSLLVKWIHLLLENKCNKIIIGVSPITKIFIDNILKHQISPDIHKKIHIKLVGNTNTMNETIIECLKNETYYLTIMGMPDTYISNLSYELINKLMNNSNIYIGSYLWNIRNTQLGKIGQCNIDNDFIIDIIDKDINCNYNYGWGVVCFKPKFEKYMYKEDLHIGYSMKRFLDNNKIIYKIMNGLYFDCGTIDGYTEYLNYMEDIKHIYIKGTIIIVAIYINNDLNNYNELIKCLEQLRNIYKNEFIVVVDNCSLNIKWYETANKLNFNILHNKSVLHKYEMGAYKHALQYYRADKYICIQGTIFLNNKIDLEILNKIEEEAIAFYLFKNDDWYDGLTVINKFLNIINLKNKENEPLITWNSFCCNNTFINNMLDSGIFDLPSFTKEHSCAFERILGCYFNNKLKYIHEIDSNTYKKIFLGQQ